MDIKKSNKLHLVMLLAWLALFLVLWFFYIYGMINLKTSDGDEMSLRIYYFNYIFNPQWNIYLIFLVKWCQRFYLCCMV